MTITRIISIGVVVMFGLAIGIATFDPVYAAGEPSIPCCSVRNGVWIVNKTGKPASPAQIRTMGTQSPSPNAAGPKVEGPGSGGGGGGGHK